MSMLTPYKGLSVLTSAPGSGGGAINTDFTTLADRIGPCNYTATTNPTSSNNISTGYYAGSRWFNLSNSTEWVCLASTSSTATWETTTVTTLSSPSVITLTDAATISTNAAVVPLGGLCSVTLGGNRTMAAPTGMVDGQRLIYRIVQDTTGSRTLTWNSAFNWGPGSAPTLSTTAGAKDYVGGIYNSTTSKWDMIAANNGSIGF